MSRYVFQFTKVDGMRFISHLDLQRLFRRVFRRIGVELVFSNGYNPHPRMNIAQPLSLGFESESEYLEIETQSPLELEQVLAEANLALPEGISLVRGTEAEVSAKNLSSVVDYAEYSAYVADWNSTDMESALAQFNLQNTIIVIKSDKKAKKTVEKDVKSMIYLFEGSQLPEGGAMFHMILRSASNETLNPLLLIESFCRKIQEPFDREGCRIARRELYRLEESKLVPLYDSCLRAAAADEKF